MKNNVVISIIVAIIIGLLVGYVAYPFVNPSDRQTTQSNGSETPTQTQVDFMTFESQQYDISFDYPSDWSIESSSQIFENGDVVTVQFTGKTQQENTEFFDGARFAVMIPQSTNLDLDSWVNSKYSVNDQISDTNINGVAFKKIYTCGLGCSTYYHAVINGKVYGINTFAEGSQKAELEAKLDQMLKTLSF